MTSALSASERLLAWYRQNRRDLPWRRTRDPYRIWVSEIMLQQTRVETVTRYFHNFLERFPTLDSLAEAEEAEVLSSWSGLGYYRRARQLHTAARRIVEQANGFPSTAAELRELPGIGPYTAAAIASIAFAEPVAVLDGNVERVVARLLGLEQDPKHAAPRRRLLAKATELLVRESAGESNQALMELGATICKPAKPECELCALLEECRAAESGAPERYPLRRERSKTQRKAIGVMIVSWGARILLVRRPDDRRLLAGTWELPWVDLPGVEMPPSRLAEADADREPPSPGGLERRYGGAWEIGAQLARVKHSVTRWALDVWVFSARLEAGEVAEGVEAGWYRYDELASIPHSSLLDKVVAASPLPTPEVGPASTSR